MISNVLFYAGVGLIFLFLLRSRKFRDANILDATAESLAIIRIGTSALMILFIIGENYPGIALMPPETLVPQGLIAGWFRHPFVQHWHAHPVVLHTLTAATLAFLLASLLGWRSRLSVGLAALGCLILGGLARQYVHFFHTGLIPAQALLVLAFTPCGDAFSLDRRKNNAKPLRSAAEYGWGRFACWSVIVLPYLDAALTKMLQPGGSAWLKADSLRYNLFTDCLMDKGPDFDGALLFLHAPDWILSVLATGAVLIELSAVLMLLLPIARRFLPWVLAGFHVAILLLHNVPFYDLMVMPLLLYDWRGIIGKPGNLTTHASAAGAWKQQVLSVVVAAFVLLPWKHGFQSYPVSRWRMYDTINTQGIVYYDTLTALLASGEKIPFTPGRYISVLHRGQHRALLLRWAFLPPPDNKPFAKLLDICGDKYNQTAAPPDRVVGFLIERRQWDFRNNPDDPKFGVTDNTAWFPYSPRP